MDSWMELRCKATECPFDDTTPMSLEKCILERGVCYYLEVRVHKAGEEEEVWKKFQEFVKRKNRNSI